MITVLVVEDEESKANEVLDVITDIAGVNGARVNFASTYVDACSTMEKLPFDILVLDLNLPRDADSSVEPMGVEILSRLSDPGRRLHQPRIVVGLTAFDDLHLEHSKYFEGEGYFLLQYSQSANEWRRRLSRIIVHAVAAAQPLQPSGNEYQTDLVIVTAMTHVEHEQVRRLPLDWKRLAIDGDDSVYYQGTITAKSGKRNVVTSSAVRMGMPASTALAMKMICTFKPRFIAICGIAAGIKGNFGDILIADQTWDYGSGKSAADTLGIVRFDPAPEAIPLNNYLRCRLADFRTDQTMLDEIRKGWGSNSPEPLRAHIGPMASGAAVLENQLLVDEIKKGQRKLIGIEMEVYGVFMAAEIAPSPKPMVFAVKSICDFGNHTKADDYQPYAAYTSANFVHRFAIEYL